MPLEMDPFSFFEQEIDQFEAAKVLHDRIRSLEPEDVATKIVGYILQKFPKQEMIRLAMGPEEFIHKLILKAKVEFSLLWLSTLSPSMSPPPISDPSLQFPPFSPASPLPHMSPVSYAMCTPFGKTQVVGGQQGINMLDCVPSAYHNHFMNVEDQIDGFSGEFYNGDGEGNRNNPVKTCHYFNKGFCKHGNSCRYFHGQQFPESCQQGFALYSSDTEDQVVSPRTLERLEIEIIGLLKSRRGDPVSIASLPMMYYEKYGRTLQAEGYLTESQRHGKAGYSLTKLLARLKSIVLIDRPHGQHSVILAEDGPKLMDIRSERNDPGPIVCGSRQIYLTYPADSGFTVADVYNYFTTFGPVQDVRIPCQDRRMFGFVTFSSADTVKMILSKGNPHYVRGARVLVKPYREKSKLVERKNQEELEPPMCFRLDDINIDPESQGGWSFRLQKEQLKQERDRDLELEARRLSRLCLTQNPLPTQSSIGRSPEDFKLTEDSPNFPSAESSLHPGEYADPNRNDVLNLPDSLL